ncbi:mitochondrial dynamics protein MID49 [Carlito syrichta]|uniref:Mitochondrial dynamics protein MID49 n=1 Tax=Carlito syrichta TaxID=1868482 RepID=A0A1U7TWL0_CARSF|nr:mitochondrial dynamics protein MID49 [Carlito syrichta]
MAEFSQKRGKRRGDEGLGSVVDFLLANARLVLGVGGAAVLGIATLAVKRFIDRATSPRDEDDAKGDGWKELSLLKATPHLQPRPPPAALSQPVSLLSPSPSAPEGPADTDSQVPPQLHALAPLCLTLQERLLAFEREHVTIPAAQVALAKQLAGDIALELQAYFRSKFPELPFGALVPGGPLYDGLQAGAADHVRLLVPLVLEPSLWSLVPGADTVARDPLDERDAGSRRRLLLLLCGVCRGRPALGQLSRDHLTQVVLRLAEEDADWAEQALGERFLQALELLIGSLEQASLPCHFSPSVNLFRSWREEEIDGIGYALYRGLQAPEGLL